MTSLLDDEDAMLMDVAASQQQPEQEQAPPPAEAEAEAQPQPHEPSTEREREEEEEDGKLPAAEAMPAITLSPEEIARKVARGARLPERVVICVDLAAEMGRTFCETNNHMDVAKDLVRYFLRRKASLRPRLGKPPAQQKQQKQQLQSLPQYLPHEFALVLLNDEGCDLLVDFTPDAASVVEMVEHLEPLAPWREQAAAAATGEEENEDGEAAPARGRPPRGAQGPDDQRGWRLGRLLGLLQEQLLGQADAERYALRAILLLGRSYALPVGPTAAELAAVRPLLGHERFFVDLLYLHAPDGESAPPPPPAPVVVKAVSAAAVKAKPEPMEQETPAKPGPGEVEVVDVLESDEEEDDVPKVSAVPTATATATARGEDREQPPPEEDAKPSAAAAAAPAPAPREVRSRAQAIWGVLTEVFGDRHPYLPQRDFLFEATVPKGVSSSRRAVIASWIVLYVEAMLSHPFQRDGQDLMMRKLDPFVPHRAELLAEHQQPPLLPPGAAYGAASASASAAGGAPSRTPPPPPFSVSGARGPPPAAAAEGDFMALGTL